jgi:hypothetical protein
MTYGENCKMSCGNCKDNITCNHINGTCMNGCADGWSGENCNNSEYNIEIVLPFFSQFMMQNFSLCMSKSRR